LLICDGWQFCLKQYLGAFLSEFCLILEFIDHVVYLLHFLCMRSLFFDSRIAVGFAAFRLAVLFLPCPQICLASGESQDA
jgi:hypothetical protein